MIRAKPPLYDEILKDEKRLKIGKLISEIEEDGRKINNNIINLVSIFDRGLALCFRSSPTKITRKRGYGFIVLNNKGIFRQRYDYGWYSNFQFTDEDDLTDLVVAKDEVIENAKSSQKDLVVHLMNMIEEFKESAFIKRIEFKIDDILQDSDILEQEPVKKCLRVSFHPTFTTPLHIYFDKSSSYWSKEYHLNNYVDNIHAYPIYDIMVKVLSEMKLVVKKRREQLDRFIEKWKPLINNIEVLWKFRKGEI